MALFPEFQYFEYKLPPTQYLGSKQTLIPWIAKYIPKSVHRALDGFSGTQAVAYYLKQLGIGVITNDYLAFNHQIGLALIENRKVQLTKEDLNILLSKNSDRNFNLLSQLYTDLFFVKNDALFIDSFRANVEKLDNKYKKALALACLNRSLTRKVTMGHFGHTQALNYANDHERVRRNKCLVVPIEDIFLSLIASYNHAVFDNKKDSVSFNRNILDLLPELKKVDLAYYDPPYCDSHSDYQGFYHLLETVTVYWKDKQFVNSIKRYDPQRWSGFDKRADVVTSLEKLFELSDSIPNWILSWNDRSFPETCIIENIIRKYRNLEVLKKQYVHGRGGKGSVAGSHELLFVCFPKVKIAINKGEEGENRVMKESLERFNHWKELHDDERLQDFNLDREGLLWLKIKSVIREGIVDECIQRLNVDLHSKSLQQKFVELFQILSQDIEHSHASINQFIREKSDKNIKQFDVERLVSELFKLKHFDWGGDYQNRLDKYLVSRYVKTIRNYDELVAKMDTEISTAVRGYVLCSWYNHWSSILIEHIFKSHLLVLPTIGQIKHVDFFINDIPFDLKVTYLPGNYVEKKRKERGLPSELSLLKRAAKELSISYDKEKRNNDIYYEITEKLKNKNNGVSNQYLESIKKVRLEILDEAIKSPRMLIRNLYEEQGEMRFSAENRLFLVLVDTTDFSSSWKLKRNLDALKPKIISYLDSFRQRKIDELKIEFRYRGSHRVYQSLSDAIFVIKEK